jgi:hypothetical protein
MAEHSDRYAGAGAAPPKVVVGLIATPPDYPARVADRLHEELAELLADRVDSTADWDVRTGWGAIAPRRDSGYEGLLDDVADRREKAGWDIAICLTDLPLQVQRVPLVAYSSLRRHAGLVSLPALGFGQMRAARAAVAGLIAGLVTGLLTEDDLGDEDPRGRRAANDRRMTDTVIPIHRVVTGAEDGETGFAASRGTGQLRLLVGMVRANRPGRALLGLSKLLVGAFGTAAFALATDTIWQMGDALDGLRLAVIMVLGITALIGWLVIAHDLWEKPSDDTTKELARLFNLGTLITLGLAVGVSYLVLFVGTTTAAALFIDRSILEATLRHPTGFGDYAALAWLITSLATVGGALGSGLEDEEHVRAAAYGHHPTPEGWQDLDREMREDDQS